MFSMVMRGTIATKRVEGVEGGNLIQFYESRTLLLIGNAGESMIAFSGREAERSV